MAAHVAAGAAARPRAADSALRAVLQAKASGDSNWDEVMRRVLSLTTGNAHFGNLPRATRFDTILEAVVPSRTDPTHEKLVAVVNLLISGGAVRPDEAAQIYTALLDRVSKYNSQNVQSNLDRLVTDVREAVAVRERQMAAGNVSSLVALNAFLGTLPATAERGGQADYVSFVSALRIMVSEAPQSMVYRSGPDTYFQTSRHGTQTVNLTRAFANLAPLWGVAAPADGAATVGNLLTPNTRLLLLLVAPFTDANSLSRDSYLGHLVNLYREAIGVTHLEERTFREVTEVSRALGQEDQGQTLQQTLNFLLTRRAAPRRGNVRLSEQETRLLRFVQGAVRDLMFNEGYAPSDAIDRASRLLEDGTYEPHAWFLDYVFDYFHRAAAMSPDYFVQAVLSPQWVPPPGFFDRQFVFPEDDPPASSSGSLVWDDGDSYKTPSSTSSSASVSPASSLLSLRGVDPANVSLPPSSVMSLSGSPSASAVSLPVASSSAASRRSSGATRTSSPPGATAFDPFSLLGARPKMTNVEMGMRRAALINNSVDDLAARLSRVTASASPVRRRRSRSPLFERTGSPDDPMTGDNEDDAFGYLRPRGRFM
ncbi:pIIIa [Guinea pig adenovirus]|nr:pIIIa [Guinea pig adenovirus]